MQLVGAHHLLKKVFCRPTTFLGPASRLFKARPVSFSPSSLSAGTLNYPTMPGTHRPSSLLRQAAQDERSGSQRGRPRLFTARSNLPWWCGGPWLPLHQAAARWGGAERWSPDAQSTWTHHRPTAVPPQHTGRSRLCLEFKPSTAPSLLVCSWHSLPSHWGCQFLRECVSRAIARRR